MTATASLADIKAIQDSLGLKNCTLVVANPDRKNIVYKKVFQHGQDVDAIQSILMPIARSLLQQKIEYPLTIVYVPLKLCGFAYKLFEHVLGKEQYFPTGSAQIPMNRMFAQFHAAQTSQMKEEILRQLCSRRSIVRVVFATVAIGMGEDIPDIRQVIHVGPPHTVKAYFQETGRAVTTLDQYCSTIQEMITNVIQNLVLLGWLETYPIFIQFSNQLKVM